MDHDPASILLIDGATGTELGRRGVDISLPLWSARGLLEAPDIVEQVHIDYLRAGSEAVITNSFRTHRRSLAKAGLGEKARELTKLSVDIARSARDKVKPDALILGSVAPLEDCYHPELAPSIEACRAEHAQMITRLLDEGVDYIIIETVNTRHEAMAVAEMASHLAPGRWIISFCTKTQGPPGAMLHGPLMVDILPTLAEAYAVGVNCIPADAVLPQVQMLRRLLPENVRVAAYANSGHQNEDGTWADSDATDPQRYAEYAQEWIDAGATIVGGCCGTTPETIRVLAERLGKASG